jgi:hypothetical protein
MREFSNCNTISIVGICILLRVLSNHKINPSFATIDKCVYLVFSSITSRHVSASTCGHLQVISVTQNINNTSHYSLQRSVGSNGI